jgi:hypothetical protein
LSNKLKFIASLLSVSLLSGCNGTTGSGNAEVGMQSNAPPTNTGTVPTAKPENPTPATGDAVRVARWSRHPNGPVPLAPLKGRLAVVNNCLVTNDSKGNPILLIFPYDRGVWDDAKQTFTFEGKVIKIGEPIELTGGSIQNLDDLKAFGKYDVPDCGANYFFQAF